MLVQNKIRFKPEPKHGFYATLRQRVEQYFSTNKLPKSGDKRLWFKAALLLTLYFTAYTLLCNGIGSAFLWYAAMGALTVPLILNIGHEAVHDTFTSNPKINKWFSAVFHLAGADAGIWKARHVDSHHLFPNIYGHDRDIQQSKLARLAPQSVYLPIHRFQHFYMPMLYLVYTMNWLLYRDFKDYASWYGKSDTKYRGLAILLLTKLCYIGYVLVFPIWVGAHSPTKCVLGFIFMQFVLSATTFLILVSSHVGEHAIFPAPDASGQISHTWSEHQLITTTDFAPDCEICTFLFGGFNHHVVHHLFPRVSHIHYPALTRITRETALQFGLEYKCFDSLGTSVVSHFHFLKNNSLPLEFFAKADV